MRAFFIAAAFALAACTPAAEPEAPAGRLEISDPWAAPTPGGVTVSAGYFTIINGADEADRLVSVSSARAGRVEVHEMVMTGDVMQMRPAAALEIAPDAEIVLAPGGLHLMFYDIATPFAEGEEVPVTLTFEHAGALDVSLPVRRPTGGHLTH